MKVNIINLDEGIMDIVDLDTERVDTIPLIVLSDLSSYAEEVEDISDDAGDYLTVEYDEDLTDDSDSFRDEQESDLMEAYAI